MRCNECGQIIRRNEEIKQQLIVANMAAMGEILFVILVEKKEK
jgi:hypothetical protein